MGRSQVTSLRALCRCYLFNHMKTQQSQDMKRDNACSLHSTRPVSFLPSLGYLHQYHWGRQKGNFLSLSGTRVRLLASICFCLMKNKTKSNTNNTWTFPFKELNRGWFKNRLFKLKIKERKRIKKLMKRNRLFQVIFRSRFAFVLGKCSVLGCFRHPFLPASWL